MIGEQALPDRLRGQKFSTAYKKLRSLPTFLANHSSLPFVASLGGVAKALVSNLVANTIICFDDLERKSPTLSVNEIMGIISQLRDERNCKIILILNENNLNAEERNEFDRYAEKVINRELRFLPTPEEAASIAFPSTDRISSTLTEACTDLRILNVRVMKKIADFAEEIGRLMDDIDETVRRNVLRTLVVLVWATFSPVGEGAPTLEYLIEKRPRQHFGSKNQEFSDEEADWGALLNDYGFNQCDDFDLLMVDGVKNGYFDNEKIKSGVDEYLRDLESSRANAAIEAAWRPFHDSFDNNEAEVAQSIFEGCSAHINYISAFHLDSAVSLLKAAGSPEKGQELLDRYLIVHAAKVFDRTRHPFGSNLIDPDVIAALDKKAKEFVPKLPSALEAASKIYKGSWSPDDEAVLAALSAADLVKLFAEMKGPDRSTLIFGCLDFRKLSSPSAQQAGIAANATEALICLGRRSSLNALRLRAFNVNLPTTENSEQHYN